MNVSAGSPECHARLDGLIERERASAWDADAAFDWRIRPRAPLWIGQATYRELVSQLYHAERASAAVIGGILETLDDPIGRSFLRIQLRDEARHAATYARYADGFGGLTATSSALDGVTRALLDRRDEPLLLIGGCHILLEGEALHLLSRLIRVMPCPLFRTINARVARDEARHFAFGKFYLRARLPKLGENMRRRMFDQLKAIWWDANRHYQSDFGGLSGRILRATIASPARRWRQHAEILQSLGLVAGS